MEDERGEIFGSGGGVGAGEDVAYPAHLLHGSGEDFGIAVADTDDCSAATGVDYGARGVGEVHLDARGMGDVGWDEGRGADEEEHVWLGQDRELLLDCLWRYPGLRYEEP